MVDKRAVTIMGATGSIGQSTLDILSRHPERFAIHALTGGSRVEPLVAIARQYLPDVVVIADEAGYIPLKEALADIDVEVRAGTDALVEVAADPVDVLVAAIVGTVGLPSLWAAVEAGQTIAFANKECLVAGGDLVMARARETGAMLLPVDSEHNAIFQIFEDECPSAVERLVLTASGGPFRTRTPDSLKGVTPAEAVRHPNWTMGAKISVDSATMMNKGLEVIEAWHLFPVEKKQIEVLIHPQSVIHSMVEYIDGSVLAQLGSPDMRTPIAYCLDWPHRLRSGSERLDLTSVGTLTFEEADMERFPCLALARQALEVGGCAPLILNAANEIAVDAFLREKISFTDISHVVAHMLGQLDMKAPQSISTLLQMDDKVRDKTSSFIQSLVQ